MHADGGSLNYLSCFSWALIMSLVKSTGPNAIVWMIIAIVVLALNRHASRARTHISKKLLKTFSPFIANMNTAASVIFVARVVGVLATLLHSLPHHVKRNVVVSGLPFSLGHFFGEEAAATCRISTFHSIGSDSKNLAAIAFESPYSMAIRRTFSGWLNRNKPTESLTSDVNYLFCLRFAIPEMSEATRALFWKLRLPHLPVMTTAHALGTDR